MTLIRQLGEWVAALAAVLGPWGVFWVALADNALVPMPQGVDALLLAQSIAKPEIALLAAGMGVLGSLVGSIVLYFIAGSIGNAMLSKALSPEGIIKISKLIQRWSALLLIPVAMIPLPMPMKPIVITAGIFRMPLLEFSLAILFARAVRYFGLVLLALRYGEQTLGLAMNNLPIAIGACVLLLVLYFALQFFIANWLNRSA